MSQFFEYTLGDLMEKNVEQYPNNEALVYSDRDLRFTYAELDERVNNVAKGLMSIGIKKGDHVAIWATNVPDWIIMLFATAKIGAVLVTVNTSYRPTELEYLLKQSDANTLIIIDGYRDIDYVQTTYDLIPELKNSPRGYLESERFPYLKNIIYLGQEKHRGMYSINEIIALSQTVDDTEFKEVKENLDTHDVINMQYTSGTTGFPKGVMLTHYNIINNGYYIGERQKFTPKDRLCLPVPLFHCFGITLGVMAMYSHGGTIVPIETFDPLKVLATVQKEKCTALYGVPTMFIAEMSHPMFDMFDMSSLRTGIMAGSTCPEPVMKQVMEDMHCSEITIVYGLTEASPGITQTTTDDPVDIRASTVGKPLDGVEVKVVDPETGNELPPGVPGELCARGYNIMKGYYKMPGETAEAIDSEGWLHSGDIAMKDEHDYYKITGRLKDMIIRGGENIYPKEIEDFIYQMEDVKDIQVIGIPSEKYGEEVAAYVQLKEEASIESSDIKDFCRGKISHYKIPKYIFFTDSFPMTASGKVQKYKLREDAVNRLEKDINN